MSTHYNIEPTPTAKVLLTTTAGEIEIELFAKQTPLTSRNFLQHCLDGYYDNTIFHRLVPKFVIQGGDPTGTGSGGASIYDDGAPFKDEFHSRLKFNRRGLLGMANTGKKDDNQSQFFFTLDATPELTGKNTMFGRVVGDTWFTILKMVDLGENGGMVEGTERPLLPVKIVKTEVLVNFFDDMVKRDIKPKEEAPIKDEAKPKPKRKANAALLSFGMDDDAEFVPIRKKQRANPSLVYAGREDPSDFNNTSKPSAPQKQTEEPAMEARVPANASPSSPPVQRPTKKTTASRRERSPSSDADKSDQREDSSDEDVVAKANREIEALKASLRRTGPATATEKPQEKSTLEAMIPATSTRGRRRGAGPSAAEEKRAAALLAAFQKRLDSATEEPAPAAVSPKPATRNGDKDRNGRVAEVEDDEEEAAVCDLHFIPNCQSCSKWDEQDAKDDDDVGEGWMNHTLTFEQDRLGKDLEWRRKNRDELVVIDPRVKEKELGVRKGHEEGSRRDGGRAAARHGR